MCEYCKKEQNITSSGDLDNASIFIDEDDKQILIDFYDQHGNNYQQWFDIDYCPKCGRKLGD